MTISTSNNMISIHYCPFCCFFFCEPTFSLFIALSYYCYCLFSDKFTFYASFFLPMRLNALHYLVLSMPVNPASHQCLLAQSLLHNEGWGIKLTSQLWHFSVQVYAGSGTKSRNETHYHDNTYCIEKTHYQKKSEFRPVCFLHFNWLLSWLLPVCSITVLMHSRKLSKVRKAMNICKSSMDKHTNNSTNVK